MYPITCLDFDLIMIYSSSSRYSGILSAFGMALADVVHEAQEPAALVYTKESFDRVDERIGVLTKECVAELKRQGFPE